jgi:hypothetical protein
MRLILKKYDKGEESVVETSNDGSSVIKNILGKQEVGQRISALIEAVCDDTEKGAERLLDALGWLTEETQRRKSAYAEKERMKKMKKRSRPKQQ